MNKLMLEEINRISEIMGVKQRLINEQASIVDDVLDFVAKSPDPKLRSNLDDFVRKAGKAEYKTLDDLIRDSGKIDIEKVVPGITRKILDAGMKVAPGEVKGVVLRSLFNDDILRDLIAFDKGALSQDEFNLLYNRVKNTIETYPDRQIVDILTDSKTVQRVVNGLPKEAKVKYTIPGGRSVKTGSEVAGDIKVADDVGKGVDDVAKGSDEVASSVDEIASPEIKIEPPVELTDDELNSWVSNADFNVEEVANDLTENVIYKSFQKDPRFAGVTDAEKQKLVDEVTARAIKMMPEITGKSDELIEKVKQAWSSPKTPPSLKEKLINESFLAAKINYSPRMKQFWINYLMGLNPSTGVSKGWLDRWLRFMGFNAIFTVVGVLKDTVTLSKTSFDDLPGDSNFDKMWNLFQPGWAVLKTIVPFQMGTLAKFGTKALMSDYKAPSLEQLYNVLGKEQQLYQYIGDVRLERTVDNEFTRKVIRKSDGVNLGEYRYNNNTGKVEKVADGDKLPSNQPSQPTAIPETEEGLKQVLNQPEDKGGWGDNFKTYYDGASKTGTYWTIKLKGGGESYYKYQNGTFVPVTN